MPRRRRDLPPHDIAAIIASIEAALDTMDDQGRRIASCKHGVYAFYDFDGEPIYVGQTRESLGQRIGRHLTNQRSDAAAMHVLDPLEVAEFEMWPLWELDGLASDEVKERLAAAEYTVYVQAREASQFKMLLNEKDVEVREVVELPASVRAKIVPDEIFDRLNHPDFRIARRTYTIAELAQVIAQRSVSLGLRRTLVTQAIRLEALARRRLDEAGGQYPVEEPGEETGERLASAEDEADGA